MLNYSLRKFSKYWFDLIIFVDSLHALVNKCLRDLVKHSQCTINTHNSKPKFKPWLYIILCYIIYYQCTTLKFTNILMIYDVNQLIWAHENCIYIAIVYTFIIIFMFFLNILWGKRFFFCSGIYQGMKMYLFWFIFKRDNNNENCVMLWTVIFISYHTVKVTYRCNPSAQYIGPNSNVGPNKDE